MLLASRRSLLSGLVIACLWPAQMAQATTILDTGLISFAPAGTQLGRLSRNGTPSTWGTTKPFPGTLNPTTLYQYEVFTVNAGTTPFLQITLTDTDQRFLAAAYLNAYLPVNIPPNQGLDVNYLGDAGVTLASTMFQIQVAPFSTVLVVISGTAGGLQDEGRPIRVLVEGFTTPPAAVPEPATLMLVGSGVAVALRRRTRV